MQDRLIIPTFTRPEFLWLCLEHVAACPEAPSLAVHVYADSHEPGDAPLGEIEAVLGRFPGLAISLVVRAPHAFKGNSFNVLNAYKDAYESPCGFVFMVEDDIIVAPDFFQWHYAVQRAGDWFCAIAAKHPRMAGKVGQGSDAYVASAVDYASLGVSFRREKLAALMPHVNEGYFSDLSGYVSRNLPFDPRFACEDAEQDGLTLRVMGNIGGRAAWAVSPKAQHVGWYGYHRRDSLRPNGPLEQRYQEVKGALADAGKLRAYVRDFNDIEPLGLGGQR